MAQKNWDKYEVALLIEAYQNIKQGRVDKNSALEELSQNLRQMAKNEGLEIDDVFRNMNGMQWQLGFIEKAFTNDEYESRVPPKIFIEMSDLYSNNPKEFRAILEEAHRRVEEKKETDDEEWKEKFIEWLSSNASNISSATVVENISNVSEYAVKRSISKNSFWSFRSYKGFNVVRVKLSGNKLFKLMHVKEHRQFEKYGKLYSDFLKEQQLKAEECEPVVVTEKTQASNDTTTAAITDSVAIAEPVTEQTTEQILNLSSIPDLSYTKPIFATLKGIEIDAMNWKMIYISVLNLLYRVCSNRLNNYCGKSLCGGSRIDLSFHSSDLISPKLISSQYSIYAESNLSANDIARRLVSVLNICGVAHSDLIIKYKIKENFAGGITQVKSVKPTGEVRQSTSYQSQGSDLGILAQYIKWLIEVKGIAESTSRSYGSSLWCANLKAQEMGLLNGSLFDVVDETLQGTIKNILYDSDFAKYNAEQHNRFSAALNAYLMFKIGQSVSGLRLRKVHKQPQEEIVCSDDLKLLLIKKFPYGIRIDSEIDIIKLKNYADMFNVQLPENDEALKAQIAFAGVAYEGKLYFISDEFIESLISKLSEVFSEGYSVIYYEELFKQYFDWFDENHISEWGLIKEILSKCSEDLFISKNFLRNGAERINEVDAVEKEMECVWGESVVHTYDELYELLPYIPDDKIKFYLSRSQKFVWSTFETFAWIDKVIITEEEKQAIVEFTTNECELNGHTSIANVPLGNIEEENYQISISAVYDAIYNLILKDMFSINGKILTKNDSGVDALTLAKSYCVGKDVCTFTELNDYVTSINGVSNRQITFRAAYDQLVRVDAEKFVADSKVDFQIDVVDEVLDQVIDGEFASIKSIATFIMFPNCGFTWTHYLLESYCYRFSKKYRLEVINFNDKNAGIIVKKDAELSYTDMLASVAAHSKLQLRADIIGQFLYENGYIARRKAPIIDNAIEMAKVIREGN